MDGVLHRETSSWNHKLNDITFLDSSRPRRGGLGSIPYSAEKNYHEARRTVEFSRGTACAGASFCVHVRRVLTAEISIQYVLKSL